MSRGGRDDESRDITDDERPEPTPGSLGAGRGSSSDNTTTDAPSPPQTDAQSSARDPARTVSSDADREVARSPAETLDRSDSWSASRDLTLPQAPAREPVTLGRDRYRLRASEVEVLATIGTFRVVPGRDLQGADGTDAGDGHRLTAQPGDLRSLLDQRLIQSHTVVVNEQPERVFVLTDRGKALLESHRTPDPTAARGQQYYAGLVKPRELAHDAQLYRVFEIERGKLEEQGARVHRVVLDYELKRQYHAYVHEQGERGVDAPTARKAFANERNLPFVKGHIRLPDVRIEYQMPDGREEHRDLELATEHYSRSQVAGKQSAGFRVYRSSGVRLTGSPKTGGAPLVPSDPEWLH
jgi:hypothetical protein